MTNDQLSNLRIYQINKIKGLENDLLCENNKIAELKDKIRFEKKLYLLLSPVEPNPKYDLSRQVE